MSNSPLSVVRRPAKTNVACAARQAVEAPTRLSRPSKPVIEWRIVAATGLASLMFVGGVVAAIGSIGRPDAPPASEVVALLPTETSTERKIEPATTPARRFDQALGELAARVALDQGAARMGDQIAQPGKVNEAPAAPAVSPPKPQPEQANTKPAMKRRNQQSERALERELRKIPEFSRDDLPAATLKALAAAPKNRELMAHEIPDLKGLPMRMGLDCQLSAKESQALQSLSLNLRRLFAGSMRKNGDNRLDPDALRQALKSDRRSWAVPEAVPTLMQMLMGQETSVRLVLIEMLGMIENEIKHDPRVEKVRNDLPWIATDSTSSTQALASRAMFDLDEKVREAAIDQLKNRKLEDFRDMLLGGLRHPLGFVADHAAEALVALGDVKVASKLVDLLDAPDPLAPMAVRPDGTATIREVVRINHLSNCQLCHATATATTDPVRGRVPDPSQPLPPETTQQYYQDNRGIFVRADVTYLKQDFSVVLPVPQSKEWPAHQRYDFVVRTRPMSLEEVARLKNEPKDVAPKNYPQRESVLFALRELTGVDKGDQSRNWRFVAVEAANQAANPVH
jgi:hypothetical protein